MTALLIIAAITAAVALVFRYAVPRRKPEFSTGERLTRRALLYSIGRLSKRCAVTEVGFGINAGDVKPRRIFAVIEKELAARSALDEWAQIAYDAHDLIADAYERAKTAVRKSYAIGHVDGVPRLFMLCNNIVVGTQADISVEGLTAAVRTFEINAPLTRAERELFVDMMRFCLCGYFCVVARSAQARAEVFSDGVADGAVGKADLDHITHDDYVCGLLSATDARNKPAADRLLEVNGVDVSVAQASRQTHLANVYTDVSSVISSLEKLNAMCGESAISRSLPLNLPDKAMLRNYYLAPFVILVTLSAVLTCLYAPRSYFAVFMVAAIIVFARFRLSLIFKYPNYSIDNIPIRRRVQKSYKRSKPQSASTVGNDEVMRVDGENGYYGSSISSEAYEVKPDNFGRIQVLKKCGKNKLASVEDHLDMFFGICGKTVPLSKFDLSTEPHKSVYRYVCAEAEISAEFIAPVAESCCCCKISVVNRTEQPNTIDITALYTVDGKRTRTADKTNNFAVAANSDGVVALAFDVAADYGKPVSEIAIENGLHLAERRGECLTGVCAVDVHGFEKRCALLSVSSGTGLREVMRIAEYVSDDGYFERESTRARAYCRGGRYRRVLPIAKNRMPAEEDKSVQNPLYESKRLPDLDRAIADDHCGFLPDGAFFVDVKNGMFARRLRHDMFDGRIGVELSQNGINGLYASDRSNGITFFDDSMIERVPICVMIGEGEILWSPTALPFGKGELRVTQGFSQTVYENSYNGCVCTLKCYIARASSAVIFDVTVENTENVDRRMNIMFAFRPPDGAAAVFDGEVVIVNNANKSFKIVSSVKPSECALFLEQYSSHGEIDRTDGFAHGGNIVAPAVAVSAELCARGRTRTVFVVDASGESKALSGAECELFADTCLLKERRFCDGMFGIVLKSDDEYLNVMHKRALYQAHVYGVLGRADFDPFELCALLAAEKYVDKAAVKSRLIALFVEQSDSGKFRNDFRGALYIAYAAIDYAAFAADYGFWDELVEYAPRRVHGRKITVKSSVAEHCMRALDGIVASDGYFYDKTVRGIYDCKIFSELLRFFADMPNVSETRKARYVALLGKVAAKYAEELAQLRLRSFYSLNSVRATVTCAKLLFDAGEYDKAYNLLKYNNPLRAVFADRNDDENAVTTYFAENGDINAGAVAAALYYTTVTECLIGLKLRDGKISMEPNIGVAAPHIRLELPARDGRARIDVDGSEPNGEWRIRVNRISYSAANVEFDWRGDTDILLYRSGERGCE